MVTSCGRKGLDVTESDIGARIGQRRSKKKYNIASVISKQRNGNERYGKGKYDTIKICVIERIGKQVWKGSFEEGSRYELR